LNVDETSNACDVELAMSVAAYFRLDADQAKAIADNMGSVIKGWERVAQDLSISRDEIERMRVAFER
jgi:serine/threonine-protein kinase HipA